MMRSSMLALLLAAPCSAGRKAEVPPPTDLLSIALSPTASYQAKGRAQYYPEQGKPRSQALSVAASGARVRKEYARSAKKPAALVLSSDGKTRSLLHVKPGTLWSGPALDDSAAYSRILQEVYSLSSSTGGVVAKRSTWRLDFREKRGGALRRSWWLDRKSGAVLRREQYRADGKLWRRERFSRFAEGEQDGAAFAAPSGPALPWAARGGLRWRPDGFVPLPGEAGYGDGTTTLALSHGKAVGDLLEDELLRAEASVEVK